jgi:CubicO group peptidase (beta-lactamase class C family)
MFKAALFLLAISSSAFAFSEKAERAEALLEGFDSVVEEALRSYSVPGMAIGVIVDGELVYAKGFGVCDLQRGEPVDAETIFPIGSCSKAFTAFLMGELVDQGKVEWDQKVIDVLPDFRLFDAYATQSLTIRDLLSHKSGMPRHDFMWYNSKMSREEVMSRLRFLEPSHDIRERFIYNNLMYLTAGTAIERLEDKTWEEVVSEKILKPLGMTRTSCTVEELEQESNIAYPHFEKNGELKKVPFRDFHPVAPGVSINSTVVDLSRWVKMHLDCGSFEHHSLISPSTLQEICSPQVIVTGAPEGKGILFHAYGLGWNVAAFRGHYFLSHDGGLDGFTSAISFFPKERIGIVVLSNKNLTSLPRFISFQVLDRLLELPPIDWIEDGLEALQKTREQQCDTKLQEDLTRKKGTSPSHPLEDYVGEYVHPGYGTLSIQHKEGELRASLNGIECILEHWHYDVFTVAEETQSLFVTREGIKFFFQNNLTGDIDELRVPFEPSTNDIVFKRKENRSLSEIAYLKRFSGLYEIYGYTVEIAVRGDALCAIVPGQPLYELIPLGENEFSVKSRVGFTVRFVMNACGSVEEVVLIQPYGAFSATPKR